MRYLFIIGACMVLAACSDPIEEPVDDNTEEIAPAENLIEINGNQYTEYYPGRKKIKFQGTQDEEGKRHGQWSFYNEKGIEISMTMYEHGLKHGHSIVKYENGAIFYMGEYHKDQQVGVWKTYASNGKLETEKDFGPAPEE
jgi:antitoxin component YwqK of YwqJK toxin-antitoxin module